MKLIKILMRSKTMTRQWIQGMIKDPLLWQILKKSFRRWEMSLRVPLNQIEVCLEGQIWVFSLRWCISWLTLRLYAVKQSPNSIKNHSKDTRNPSKRSALSRHWLRLIKLILLVLFDRLPLLLSSFLSLQLSFRTSLNYISPVLVEFASRRSLMILIK